MTQPLHVSGDIDADHGDIDAAGDLVIQGSVTAACSIRAAGQVTIHGGLTAGVRLSSRADIHVEGTTAGAQIRAGGLLSLGSNPATDALVGGDARAVNGVTVHGALRTPPQDTLVGILADPATSARLEKAQEGRNFVENEIGRILRTLELPTVSETAIRDLFQRTPMQKRKFLIEILKQLRRFVGLRQQLVEKHDAQHALGRQHLASKFVSIVGSVHQGVRVAIGQHEMTADAQIDNPTFYLEGDAVQWRPSVAAA